MRTLEDVFKDLIEQNAKDDELDVKTYLTTVEDHGVASGVVNGLEYYYQGAEIFDAYESKANAWLLELCNESGESPEKIWAGWWAYEINSPVNKWLVISAMFEAYAAECLEELEG